MLREPLTNVAAKKLIVEILASGAFTYSKHAITELANDNLSTVDAVNILRGGVVEFAEEVSGTWRYRVRTPRMVVVVAFRSETEMRVITAWRIKS